MQFPTLNYLQQPKAIGDVWRMYHDRYSRRRAADSFHEEEEEGNQKEDDSWSWALFIGVIFVQVISRSVWSSFGVISLFIFGDEGPSWVLLATPIAFAVAWGLTEPWVKRICKSLNSATEFMYVIIVGTVLSWFGALIAARMNINLSTLVPLLGIVGGCGSNITSTASTSLVKKHFPKRSGAVRFFEQITAALAFFLMPAISCFTMDTYGEHGGLLIHGGILMQCFIGGSLLKCAKWNQQERRLRRPRAYAFTEANSDPFDNISDEENQEYSWQDVLRDPAINKHQSIKFENESSDNENKERRIAFGLSGPPTTPPELRRKKIVPPPLPVISEEEEEDSSFLKGGNGGGRESIASVNSITKPPRTFEHKFPDGRSIAQIDDFAFDSEVIYINTAYTISSENKNTIQIEHNNEYDDICERLRPDEGCVLALRSAASQLLGKFTFSWQNLTECSSNMVETLKWLNNPLVIPAAFLLYATQSSLLGFLALSPALLDKYIEDGTKIDGAYCVCIMGFTWLCFVIASPCCSTIHFSNHQTICIVSLLSSSLTLYMFSQSTTLDEMVFYSSLFGLFHGISRMTSHSILKMSFGSEALERLGVLLSVIASIFQLIFLLIVIFWEWCHNLKNLYKFQVVALVCSALFWTIQGFVSSVRAKRGHHEFTWSRRRRVS